ncbi:deazapurine DNA modification protein DpdA family protein [Nocardia aurea]|uniref:deazapurine DNA modification protein DpdA family protein n=1 Tax=Nocardia aurea TaxID=2144174 RepID=UPI0013009319|nr:hypothetical protein [Nocardia aurea]
MRLQILGNGAFTQIQRHGNWNHAPTPAEYADHARRYSDEIGLLSAISPQDWCCEPQALAGGRIGRVVFAGTGLTVRGHQHRTVDNFARLRELAPELPFMPVLQGWTVDDYLRCIDLYTAAGFDLAAEPLVGVGSICRRQASAEAARIFAEIVDAAPALKIHAFGVKLAGIASYGSLIRSSDSMAWSKAAVHAPPLPGCHHRHCGNCATYALRWRAQVIAAYHAHRHHPQGIQLALNL